jgi:isopentenyl-diphosphate Delta-isomerase
MINPSEELDIVDTDDRVIGSLTREQVHKQMALHRVSLIWTINEKRQVLCQKRSTQKDRWPGMWECWFGGHVLTNQTYLDTAVSETKEELGIDVKPKGLLLFGKRTTHTAEENLFLSVYALRTTLDINSIKFEKEEIELLQWFSIDELKNVYTEGDSKWVTYGYELEMLDWLESKF